MSTDKDCFIPTTETSSLSHKGTMPVGIEQPFFFFFFWCGMSKSGNGFYISSVISRASRWASRVFILQTPNLDLPAHMDEGAESHDAETVKESEWSWHIPPPKFLDECPQTNEKSMSSTAVRRRSACIFRWNIQYVFMLNRSERLFIWSYIVFKTNTTNGRFWLSFWFLGKTKIIQDSQPLF